MNSSQFDAILSVRIAQMRDTLASKAAEYATETDRLASFKEAAKLTGESPMEALMGMLVKHWVSIQALVGIYATGRQLASGAVDEKIGDAINYLVLLEALFREKGVV